jgi:hypothetical protein
MNRENTDAAAPRDTGRRVGWQRPEFRRIEAGMAEGSRGLGPVDFAFSS